jgi:signal transduction histidine kinase/ligand-binding sensor domain-containing protein
MYHLFCVMSYLRNGFFMSLCLTIAFSPAHGQAVRKIGIRHKLSTEFGLSSYNVNKILQDPYGYVWLGTQDGLNRYDGRNFIIYSRSSDSVHRLLGNVINDMVLDTSRKLLWVTTSYGGLNGIDLRTGGVVHSLKSSSFKDKFPSEWLKCLNIANGKLWIGSLYGLQVYDPDKRTFVQIDKLPGSRKGQSDNVGFIYPDRYGHVWVSFPDVGLVVYDASSGRIVKEHASAALGTNETLSFLQFSSRFISWSGNQFMWATDHGFRLLTYDREGNIIFSDANLPVNNAFGTKPIFSCAKDPQGNLWFSTFDHLYVWDPRVNKYETIEDIVFTPANDYLNTVMDIFFDDQDNLWLGTQYGAGICDYQQPAIVPFYRDRNSDVRINHAFFVLPANDTVIYVAAQHGAFAVNKHSGSIRMLSEARRFNFIFKTPDGRFIFSNDQGLQLLLDGKMVPITDRFAELNIIRNEMLNGAVNSGDSIMLLSSEKTNEVFLWDFSRRSLSPLHISSKDNERGIINTLYLDHSGTAWMLFDNLIASYSIANGSSATISLSDPDLGIPMNIFMDMCELQGDYWVAVYGRGILRMNKTGVIKKIYGVKQGLSNTGAYTVLPFRDSLLFITTNFGMYTIDPLTDRVRQYLVSDGLNTNNFEENCGVMTADEIIAGGEQGISVIRPEYFRERRNGARIYVNSIVCEKERGVEDTFNLFMNRVRIGNDVKQATIAFAALEYAHPEKVKYAYRIPQLSAGWIDLGSQNFITLVGLMPGEYSLEVKASSENGVESMAPGVRLYVAPKWHQTLLFRLLVALAVAGLFYAFYRYRVQQIRRQEQMRRDIATDLHDDIGSTLNSAKIFAHLAKKDDRRVDNLELVDQTLAEASAGLRDIIWLLDDSRDTYADFVERINRFARPITDAKGIRLQPTMDPQHGDRALGKAEKKTFFLIAKEAINNSIKHSDCSTITYEIKSNGDAHVLIVADDGKGFDTGTANAGNGLGNMKYRADRIGYRLELESSAGKGVRLTLKKR